MAAQRIIAGEADVIIGGGVESISCVQQEMNRHMIADSWLKEHKPSIYMSMLETAENVAKRYKIDKERMDQYGAGSQQKACAAQEAGNRTFALPAGCTAFVTVQSAAWMAGGSYLVSRRISMHIETWDRTSMREQEMIFGRDKGEGAPLSGGTEFTEPDFDAEGPDGEPKIALMSHVRLAHPDDNDGVQILRRGYNFTDGTDGLGRLDAGLFFIAFVRDPRTQYVPMQTKLSRDDLLMEYLVHTGSGLFAVPPGVTGPGRWVGQDLFA